VRDCGARWASRQATPQPADPRQRERNLREGLATGSYILEFTTATGDSTVDTIVFAAPFQVR
jgi:hypothetical protein